MVGAGRDDVTLGAVVGLSKMIVSVKVVSEPGGPAVTNVLVSTPSVPSSNEVGRVELREGELKIALLSVRDPSLVAKVVVDTIDAALSTEVIRSEVREGGLTAPLVPVINSSLLKSDVVDTLDSALSAKVGESVVSELIELLLTVEGSPVARAVVDVGMLVGKVASALPGGCSSDSAKPDVAGEGEEVLRIVSANAVLVP